jgi:hypothetical protein
MQVDGINPGVPAPIGVCPVDPSSMRTAQEIKNQLIETLAEILDGPLKAAGFARNKRSLVYCRKVNGTEHRITFTVHCHPKYQPGAEAHIYPSLQVLMPQVSEAALALVKNDKLLLANSPEIIIGEPIEFTAPKDKHQRWFATGGEQFAAACGSIQAFLSNWALPFLSEVSTPVDLIKLHETNDERIVKSHNWHIFIAAAYQIMGRLDKARDVVRRRFGRPGLRKQFAPLFASLAIE